MSMRRGTMVLALALAAALGAVEARAAMPDRVVDAVGKVPVMSGGRVRPFVSFAQDAVRQITGKSSWRGEAPTETVLRWMAFPDSAYSTPMIEVAFEPLLRVTGLEATGRERFSMSELLSNQSLRSVAQNARSAQMEGLDLTVLQDRTIKVMRRLNLLQGILTHQSFTILPPEQGADDRGWRPPHALQADSTREAYHVAIAYTGLIEAYRHGDWDIAVTAAGRLHKDLLGWHGDEVDTARLHTEFVYRDLNPWRWAQGLYLVAVLLVLVHVAVKKEWLHTSARLALLLGFLIHTAALGVRWYIGGRAPWSNMFESLVTITWGVVLFGLLPYRGQAKRVIVPATALLGFVSLAIASHPSLSPAIDPLVPALQSVWLNIHVIVILLGYAAATLAMGAGHAWLAYDVFKPADDAARITIAQALYRLVQFAVLFLIVGIILGSVWAHAAWGRYWGWDPKETWALITWFFYLGLVHARQQGWLGDRGLALSSLFGFLLVLMTYYGVNYFLAGLHSYASGEAVSVPAPILAFVVLEVAVAGVYGWYVSRRDRPRPTG